MHPRKRISIKSATVAGVAASALLGLTGLALNPAPAKAVVYCQYVSYPAGCVAKWWRQSRWSSAIKAGRPRLVRRYMWLSPSPATAQAVPSPKQQDELCAAGRRLPRGALLTMEMMDKIQRGT
jgi:hypothetical protein